MRRILLITSFLAVCQIPCFSQVLGDPIMTWDFADGLPTGWETGIVSTNNIAHWEYRGPNTTPDVTVGARGSCSSLAVPINSVTKANGFMIFDSNYWDHAGPACNFPLGTGVDPAPHNAWMTTNSLDLSAHQNVVLTFQQQYRHYQTTVTKVEVSANGGEWVEVINNTGPIMQSLSVQWKTANISAQAAGQSDVRIRFSFVGVYYWWLLDDITLYTPYTNDLMLDWVGYTTNPLGTNTVPYSDLQYDKYPSVMIPPFSFRARTTNVGANEQTNVRLNTRIVRNGVTETYNTNSSSTTITPNQAATLVITPNYTNPATLGDYKIYYDILQNESDDNPSNDIDSLDYSITAYTYARDEGPMVNSYESSSYYSQWPYEIGNMFQIRADGKKCHSLQVAIAEGTQPGTQIKGYIYEEDMETLIAETNIYSVNIADLNSVGQEKIVTLHFPTPLTLTNNAYYMAMITQLTATPMLKIARSGTSPAETSYIRYTSVNGNFYSPTTPIVRMNIFNTGVVSGCNDPTAMNFVSASVVNDGSCRYPGCTNEAATNYNPNANFDNGTCVIAGCMNPLADNYNPNATVDNGNCIFYGCTDDDADNYDPEANTNDGTCIYSGCTNPLASNYNPQATIDDGSCIILGCMDENADNYNPDANEDNGSCIYYGCTDQNALNFNPQANEDDGSCTYLQVSMQLSAHTGCAPLTVTITNQTFIEEGGTCTFEINDETILSECVSTYNYTFESPGSYEFTYTYSLGEISSDTTVTITVYPSPETPLISYNANDFEISCSNCGDNSIEWLHENTVVADSSEHSLNIFYDNIYRNGYYKVRVTEAENQCSTASEPLFVLQPYFSLNNEEGCAPMETQVTNLTDFVENAEYVLNFGDGTTDENFVSTSVHEYAEADTYQITVMATSPLGEGSYSRQVTAHPVITPVLVHVPNDGLIICENCNLFQSVVWNIDGTIFNDFGPHSDGGESYTVTGTTEFGCEGSAVILPTSIRSLGSIKDRFKLYPNPAREYIMLSQTAASPYELEVYDFTGHKVYQAQISSDKQMLDIASWSAGMYLVKINNSKEIITFKLTVAH